MATTRRRGHPAGSADVTIGGIGGVCGAKWHAAQVDADVQLRASHPVRRTSRRSRSRTPPRCATNRARARADSNRQRSAMQNRRALLFLILAIALGVGAAFTAQRWLEQQRQQPDAGPGAPPRRSRSCASTLQVGQIVHERELATVDWPLEYLPAGRLLRPRAARRPRAAPAARGGRARARVGAAARGLARGTDLGDRSDAPRDLGAGRPRGRRGRLRGAGLARRRARDDRAPRYRRTARTAR